MAGKLNAKQQRFVSEYLLDCNATQAAIRAGYRHGDVGRQLLTKTHVGDAIADAKARMSNKLELQVETVLREYQRLAFSDIGALFDARGKLLPVESMPENARRAVASIKTRRFVEGSGDAAQLVETTEIRLWPKLDALHKLAEHLDLFASKQSLRVDVTSGGRSLADRNSLTAADLAACAALVAKAGLGCVDL